MEDNYAQALRYLSSPAGSFWRWDDQGAVVVWSNGSTLAFREELTIIVERLAPGGLPPIDAILLLIAATRAYWAEDSVLLQHLMRSPPSDDTKFISKSTHDLVSRLFVQLDEIHALPDELIRTTESKSELVATVFESAVRVIDAAAARVVYEILAKRLNDRVPDLFRLRGGQTQTIRRLTNYLWPLCRGLEGISAKSLKLRQKTGIDVEPAPEPIELPIESQSIHQLLQELSADTELAGLSRLARNLAAVVQLPRAINDADDLPSGGVSDLSHRGSFDRLLLSELAHDDLMLATRVALNEALYLRREIPPSFPPERRYVLLDAGLRMWGVPRVYATAVALSLGITGVKGSSLSAYRAAGDGIEPVLLSDRESVIEHLAALETEVHPGRALPEFLSRISLCEQPGDIVLVTTDTVLEDPDFQRELSQLSVPVMYVATVNRDGAFQLWTHNAHGRKCHSTLRLDLDAILTSPQKNAPKLIDRSVEPNLPAIFRAKPFPFRLPAQLKHQLEKETVWWLCLKKYYQSNPERLGWANSVIISNASGQSQVRLHEDGVMLLTRDRLLLFFDNPSRGGRVMGEGLPFGRCLHSWSSDDGLTNYALIYRESEPALYLLTIDLLRLDVQKNRLPSESLARSGPGSQLLGAATHGSTLFVIYRSIMEAYAISTQELLDRREGDLPEKWLGRRFFLEKAPNSWAYRALSFDGSSIRFEEIPLEKWAGPTSVQTFFERREPKTLFAITNSGCLVNVENDTGEKLLDDADESTFRVLDIDEDGGRIMYVSNAALSKNVLAQKLLNWHGDLSSYPDAAHIFHIGSSRSSVCHRLTFAQHHASLLSKVQPPMRRFTRAFIGDQKLTLVTRRQAFWQFVLGRTSLQLVLTDKCQTTRLSSHFESVNRSSAGASLQIAEWADGSRLSIDSRGLMHLQSSDTNIPEATFILTPSHLSVWTSNAQTLGWHYYVNLEASTSMISPKEVMDTILIPFISRLRESENS